MRVSGRLYGAVNRRGGALRRGAGLVLGTVGFGVASRIGRQIGRWHWESGPPARAQAEERVRQAIRGGVELGLGPAELIRRCYEQAGQFGIELLYLRRRLGARTWRRVVSEVEDATLQAACRGRGPVIFVTGYTGNPVVAAYVLGQLCRPIHVVVEVPAAWGWGSWARRWQQWGRVRLIRRQDAAAELPRVLETGGKVLVAGGLVMGGGRGDHVSFLGRECRCRPTARVLGRRFDAPIVVLACHRVGTDFAFRIQTAGLISPECEDISMRMTKLLEETIVREPAQYLWLVGD